MAARIFTRDQLEAWGLPYECGCWEGSAEELYCEQVDTLRWLSVHELVFRAPDDGKTYRVDYVRGLTEHQDGIDLWDYRQEIEGVEVELAKVIREEWRPVMAPAA
jgi:hypothetical protein